MTSLIESNVAQCACWLGTDAAFGDRELRERCPVHGDAGYRIEPPYVPPAAATPLSIVKHAHEVLDGAYPDHQAVVIAKGLLEDAIALAEGGAH